MSRNEQLSIDDRIDERCDAFEAAWRRGQRPRVADYIRAEDEPYRNQLLCELLFVDLECRRTLGEQSTVAEYAQASSELAVPNLRNGSSPRQGNGLNSKGNSSNRDATGYDTGKDVRRRDSNGVPKVPRDHIWSRCWISARRYPAIAALFVLTFLAIAVVVAVSVLV